MKPDEIDEILLQTLDDQRLSRSEKQALSAVLDDHAHDHNQMAFFRHRAFAIARREATRGKTQLVLDWLEEVVKTLDAAANRSVHGPELAEAHFSPGDWCRRRISSLIGATRSAADICVFTITDDRIAQALLEAHHRGVQLRVATDDEKALDRGSDVEALARAGIEVRVDRTEHHMHHKFAIFDQTYLVTGSYNWTRSAAEHNEENIVVVSTPQLVHAFSHTFETLWTDFLPLRGR